MFKPALFNVVKEKSYTPHFPPQKQRSEQGSPSPPDLHEHLPGVHFFLHPQRTSSLQTFDAFCNEHQSGLAKPFSSMVQLYFVISSRRLQLNVHSIQIKLCSIALLRHRVSAGSLR